MAARAIAGRANLSIVAGTLALSLACGASGSKSSAQTTTATGGDGGGVSVATGGSGAPAEGAPPGGDSATATPTAGGQSGGVSAQGGSAAGQGGSAPSGTAGEATGASSSPSSTGGGSGSNTASACAALVPPAGAAVDVTLSTGTHASCAMATTNPAGEIALGVQGGAFSTEVSFRLYAPAGVSREVSFGLLNPNSTDDIDPWFHWTSSGYAGLVHDPPPAVALRTWSATGAVLGTTQDDAVSTAPDGQGGTVALLRTFEPGTTPLGPTRLAWSDASGHVTRTADPGGDPNLLLVSWGSAHVFVLSSGPDRARARWFDGAGAPLTAWFDAGPAFDAASDATMHLLVDGSIVVGGGHGWRALFRDGVETADPPPAWLASRPGTRLSTIRQGRAYAVLPTVESGGDPSRLEIVTAAGESCGTLSLPPPTAVAGVDERTQRVDVGQDGTVLQTSILTGADLGPGVHCRFRWWPALVR